MTTYINLAHSEASNSSDDEDFLWSKRLTFYQFCMEILPDKVADLQDSEKLFKNKYGRGLNPFLSRNSNIDFQMKRLSLLPGLEMN